MQMENPRPRPSARGCSEGQSGSSSSLPPQNPHFLSVSYSTCQTLGTEASLRCNRSNSASIALVYGHSLSAGHCTKCSSSCNPLNKPGT